MDNFDLKTLTYLTEGLSLLSGKREFERAYNGNLIVLNQEYHIPVVNKTMTIDGKAYPVTPYVLNFLKGKGDKISSAPSQSKAASANQTTITDKEPVTPTPVVMSENMRASAPVTPAPASVGVNPSQAQAKPQTEPPQAAKPQEPVPAQAEPMASEAPAGYEQTLMAQRHRLKVISKKKSTDVEEFELTVLPLEVADNDPTCSIVLCYEENGKVISVVSEKRRRSLEFTIGDTTFVVRGSWEKRKFSSFFFLPGEKGKTHTIKDEVSNLCPTELDKTVFENQFIHVENDMKVYILPHGRLNDPTGVAMCSIIIEEPGDDGKRVAFTTEEGAIKARIGDTTYRVYGKWGENKAWVYSLDQVEEG